MKKYLFFFATCLILSGCRFQSEDLLSYGHNDHLAFAAAERSYAEQFKTLWLAMNANYCIWDYEEKLGLNWDEVYYTYMPKFEALDDTTRKEPVTDAELRTLYSAFLDSLHDGHIFIQVKNISTGAYISFNPGRLRNQRERGELFAEEGRFITDLSRYRSPDADSRYKILAFDEADASTMAVEHIQRMMQIAGLKAAHYLAAVDAVGGPNETNDSIYKYVSDIYESAIMFNTIVSASDDLSKTAKEYTSKYNKFCDEYRLILRMIGAELSPVDKNVVNDELQKISFSLFEGNIAYLRLSSFFLTPHIMPSMRTADTCSMFYSYELAIDRVWHHWFDTIQTLHKAHNLGGVIIDVRNNGGGLLNDYQYVLGALLPSGGWDSHYMRVKNGVGRYDFAPIIPFTMPTYEEEHEVIDDCPIVVLANSHSGSMAENTSWGVSRQPNGCMIGTRTYGALCALNTDPADYSSYYSGAFGEQGVTPVYAYVPKYVCLYGEDLHPVEGIGIIPDIEVRLDTLLLVNEGRDSQLERALDYTLRYVR